VSRIFVIALIVAGCSAGGSKETTRTTSDTTVAPVKVKDTTVVQRQVDVKVDTVKKTHNKP
jgi:PBP1b-binding outer membrane lipoprotein LpoB